MMGEPASLPPALGALARMPSAGKAPAGEGSDGGSEGAPEASAFRRLLDVDAPQDEAATALSPPQAGARRPPAKPVAAPPTAPSDATPDALSPMMAMLAQPPAPAASEPITATSVASGPHVLPAGPVASPQAAPAARSGMRRETVADAVAAALRSTAPPPAEAASAAASSLPPSLSETVTLPLPQDAAGAAAPGIRVGTDVDAGRDAARRLPPILRTASPGIIPPAPTAAPVPATALFDLLHGGGAPSSPDGGATRGAPTLRPAAVPGLAAAAPLPTPSAATPWIPTATTAPDLPVLSGMPAPAPAPDSPVAAGPAAASDASADPVALMRVLEAAAPSRTSVAAATAGISGASADPVAPMQALEAAATPPHASAGPTGGESSSPAVLHVQTMLANTPPSGAPAPLAASAPLAQPADPAAGYDDRLGDHLAWMATQKLGHAQLRVAPEHLGPIDIRVQVDGREVRAEFHSPHAEVRQALESSLPRLRELLGQQGLQLAHAGVGQGQPQGQGRRGSASDLPGTGNATEDTPTVITPRPPESRRGRGLLDEYA